MDMYQDRPFYCHKRNSSILFSASAFNASEVFLVVLKLIVV